MRTDVLWPLASVRSKSSGEPPEPDTVFPLFVHGSSPAGVRWGLRPLFDIESRTTDEGDIEDVDMLFPLVKWRSAPEVSRFEVRPIFFSLKEKDESRLHVVPFWFSKEDEGSSWRSVLLAHFRREEGGEVTDLHWWPFWGMHREGSFRRDWTLFPFFSLATDPEEDLLEWDAFAPLLHYGTSKEETSFRALPFWWHESGPDASRTFVLPFWWHESWPDGSRTVVPPFWWRETGPEASATVVFPFWWDIRKEDTEFRMVFPFWWAYDSGKDRRQRGYLTMLLATDRRGKRSTTHVLPPLVETDFGPKGWSAHLFPVLWLDRHGEDGYTHLWPLFGYRTRGTKTSVSTLYPFLEYGWDEDSWSLDLPLPLVEFGSGKDRWNARVFPLFDAEEGPKGGEGSVLLYLAQWESKGEESSEFRVLWRLFERTSTKERSLTALRPLFRFETNSRGDSHWEVLFGLLARTTEGDSSRWRFLWFL